MKREDLEELIGETMEDMGLEELIEKHECQCCGKIFDDNKGMLCERCRIDYPYCKCKDLPDMSNYE